VELWDQHDTHWKRSIHIHGYPRYFPGGYQINQLSPLGALRELLFRCIYRGLDVSVLLAFLFCRPSRPRSRYFRHYLNLVMLWSVYKDFDLIPCVNLRHSLALLS
jgi:hypothetical protein